MAKKIDKVEGELPTEDKRLLSSGLTQEEMDILDQEAEDETAAEAKAKAAEDYKEQKKLALKKKLLFKAGDENAKGVDLVEIFIDLATHAEDIRLDGVRYLAGRTYPVRPEVARTLLDQMYRSWKHEAEISGQDENKYAGRRSREAKIKMSA